MALGAAALVLAAAAYALLPKGTRPGKPPPVRLKLDLPPGANLEWISPMVVSPDGQQVAFTMVPGGDAPNAGRAQLMLRPLSALEATAVPRGLLGFHPSWSPDGRHLAFSSAYEGLMKADLSSGSAQVICASCRPGQSTWGTKDVLVFTTEGKLSRVSAAGGSPEPVGAVVPGEVGRFSPQFLPDGRRYLYLSLGEKTEDDAIYVGDLEGDLRRRLVGTSHKAVYSPPGYLLYMRDDVLVAQPFDAESLELSGEPVAILDEKVARIRGKVFESAAWYSVSANGVLAWRPAPFGSQRQLTWFDRAGKKLGTVGEPAVQNAFGLSRDGRSAALCRAEAQSADRDIWIVDVASGAGRRLTFDPHDDCGPLWSPDDTWIAFFSNRRGRREVYRKRADGSGDDELVLASRDVDFSPDDWSSDGRFMAFNVRRSTGNVDILFLATDAEGEARATPFLSTPAAETQGRFSPNGRWIAYQSNESGIMQVYVRGVTREGRPGPGMWQVSQERGFFPKWRPDGRELFFEGRGQVLAVDVKTDGLVFEAGVPRPLGWEPGGGLVGVTRDGERLLFEVTVRQVDPIRVLLNWIP
jgi:Tol biopolymer transport system component